MSFIIHAAELGSVILPGVSGAGVEVGRDTHRPVTAANRFNRLTSVGRYQGSINFSTSGIKDLLDAMPQGSGAAALPYPCVSLATKNLTCWQLKQDDILPTLASGNVHEKIAVALGLAALTELSWAGVGQAMQARVHAWPLSADGTADYWSMTQAAAPALAPIESDFEVSSVTWRGTAIPEVGNLALSIAAPVSVVHTVGKLRPTKISAVPAGGTCDITARIQVPDAALLRSWGAHFEGGSTNDLVIVAKNFAQAGERGAASVTLTLHGVAEVSSASHGRPGSVDLLVSSVQDSANPPFTWATASA